MPTAPTALHADAPRPHWPHRLDRLAVKLFLAIAGCSLLGVGAVGWLHQRNFEQDLGDYLNRVDEARLTPLVQRLAEGHRQHGGWGWLTAEPPRWPQLQREVLGWRSGGRGGTAEPPAAATPASAMPKTPPGTTSSPHPPETAPTPGPQARRPAPSALPAGASPQHPPLTIDPRLRLLDTQGRLLLGPEDRLAQTLRRPIRVDGQLVGHLAWLPRLQVVASLEQAFRAQQRRSFAVMAVGWLLAMLVAAAGLAHWLSRRLQGLQAAAHAWAGGDYGHRIPETGHDELARLAHDLNGLAATLAEAQRERQRCIADIAHELRTPLGNLQAEIEALQDGLRPLSAAALASLAEEVARLGRLVDDLRLLSLRDDGALPLTPRPVALAPLLQELLTRHHAVLPPGSLTLELALDPTLTLQADPDRLRQVLLNLWQNTLRYSDAPAQLRVAAHPAADRSGQAVLVWEDSPPGVPAALRPRLTERLLRLDPARQHRPAAPGQTADGSGLGLSIVQALVQAHGGTLQPDDSPLGGLRWTLRWPLAAVPHPEPL